VLSFGCAIHASDDVCCIALVIFGHNDNTKDV
jgi:hypothetical protein